MNYYSFFQTKFTVVWNESFGTNVLINDLAITLFLILDFNANVINGMKIAFFMQAIIQRKNVWKRDHKSTAATYETMKLSLINKFASLIIWCCNTDDNTICVIWIVSTIIWMLIKKNKIKHQEQIGNVVIFLLVFYISKWHWITNTITVYGTYYSWKVTQIF